MNVPTSVACVFQNNHQCCEHFFVKQDLNSSIFNLSFFGACDVDVIFLEVRTLKAKCIEKECVRDLDHVELIV